METILIIPNSIIGNRKVTNQSGGPQPKFRISVKICVTYGTEIDEVEVILMEIAKNGPLVVSSLKHASVLDSLVYQV